MLPRSIGLAPTTASAGAVQKWGAEVWTPQRAPTCFQQMNCSSLHSRCSSARLSRSASRVCSVPRHVKAQRPCEFPCPAAVQRLDLSTGAEKTRVRVWRQSAKESVHSSGPLHTQTACDTRGDQWAGLARPKICFHEGSRGPSLMQQGQSSSTAYVAGLLGRHLRQQAQPPQMEVPCQK